MCRLAAYSGPSIPLQNIITTPVHSLQRQSAAAEKSPLTVNGDGFGICWYGDDDQPGVFKDVMPAWSDSNFSNICRLVKSSLFMAHVRASTQGETSRANCHPFVFGRWSFMHNGQIPHINLIKRDIERTLPDSLYHARVGTTDSELFFLLLLAMGLTKDPKRAWKKAYALIADAHNANDEPIRMACVLTDGVAVYAFRQSSDECSPSLFQSNKLDNGGQAFASEPLDKLTTNWQAVPEHSFCKIKSTGFVRESL